MGAQLVGKRETKAWLLGLKRDIPKAAAEALAGIDSIEEFTGLAVRVVADVVYAVYDPKKYERTFAFLQSIGAFTIAKGDIFTEVAIGLKLDERTAAIAGSAAGQVHYGVFMLPEMASESFFKGAAEASIPRDFGAAWLQAFGSYAPDKVVAAIEGLLK